MSQNDKSLPQDRKGCWRLSRRSFLIGTAAAGTGLLLGWRFGVPALRLRLASMRRWGACGKYQMWARSL